MGYQNFYRTECCGVVRAFRVKRECPTYCPDCGAGKADPGVSIWEEVRLND